MAMMTLSWGCLTFVEPVSKAIKHNSLFASGNKADCSALYCCSVIDVVFKYEDLDREMQNGEPWLLSASLYFDNSRYMYYWRLRAELSQTQCAAQTVVGNNDSNLFHDIFLNSFFTLSTLLVHLCTIIAQNSFIYYFMLIPLRGSRSACPRSLPQHCSTNTAFK